MALFRYDPKVLTSGPYESDPVYGEALALMSQWIAALRADISSDSLTAKVRKHKPSTVVDTCWTASMQKIVEPALYLGNGACDALYPAAGSPRTAAGAPVDQMLLKCQLKPVTASNYQRPITEAQINRLKAVHTRGVCDYSMPGVEQRPLAGTWFAFSTQGNPRPLSNE